MGALNGHGRDLAAERAQLRRQLAQLQPKDRLDLLLGASDAGQLVRSLRAADLYGTVVEVGLADSSQLVQLASPEQFKTFIDLGAWGKDRFEVHRAITWLRAARGDEPQEYLKKIHALDLEVLELLLRGTVQIHERDEDREIDPTAVSLETPDGRYVVEFLVEGAEMSGVRALLTALIAEDPFQASRLLEATRWEVPGELEETAYQFRQARLGDLGFPPLEDAAKVFAFAEPEPSGPGRPAESRELAAARVDYLTASLRDSSVEQVEEVEQQIRYLANEVLVSEAAEPGDVAAARGAVEAVRDYVALGFEHLCGADSERAKAVLESQGIRRIFQIGFSLTLKLKFRVDRLERVPLARIERVYLAFPPEAHVLSALRRKRPLRALPVEGAEPVPFRTLAELAAAEEAVARGEQQIAFLSALLGGSAAAAAEALRAFQLPLLELGVDRLFAAILAHALLDGTLRVAPVDVECLPRLLEAFGGGESPLRADVAARVLSTLGDKVPAYAQEELRRQIERTLMTLATELTAALKAGEPRAIACLPLRGL